MPQEASTASSYPGGFRCSFSPALLQLQVSCLGSPSLQEQVGFKTVLEGQPGGEGPRQESPWQQGFHLPTLYFTKLVIYSL